MANGEEPPALPGLRHLAIGEDLIDRDGHFTTRFDATPGAAYLVRPDQHLAARWRAFDADRVQAGLDRILARTAAG